MKILVVTNSSGGLYKFRKELLEKLVKKKYDVICLTPFDSYIDELNQIGVRLIEYKMNRRGKNIFLEFKLLKIYWSLIKKENPNKIITYTIKPNLYCGIISRIYKKEFYPNVTGLGMTFQKENILRKLIIKIYRSAFKNANKIFFENEINNKIFIDFKICKKENSVILKGAGVNLEEFSYKTLPNFKTINFIFMGRIMREKGIDELFYAIREIKKQYSNVHFLILGSLEEDYKKELQIMEREGLLNYYGSQKDVKKYIQQVHGCILPSYHEGMSNTLLECGAMGRILITSDIPGCREAVINNETGFLFEVKNKIDLKNKIIKFIETDNETKIKMSNLSREHIEKNFNKKSVVEITCKHILE